MSPVIMTVTPASVSGATPAHAGAQVRHDRPQVKQRLRGVLVHAVARVDHGETRGFFQ